MKSVMAKLLFPPSTEKVGKLYSVAEFDSASPNTYIRELLQNALDAHAALQKNGGGGVIVVKFTLKQ